MTGKQEVLRATGDVSRVEAPITIKAYLMCAFAAFGGILFGYDSGYISGVNGMTYFIHVIDGPDATTMTSWKKSLIVCILSAGTFVGAVSSADIADAIGRRTTVILGCIVFIIGVILQDASKGLGLMIAGRLIAGFGVGFVSAMIILYMSEIAPKKVRGAIVAGYQFFVTIGLMLASCVDYATENRNDTGSYRIPIAIQFLWGLILGTGLFFLPETPRFFVRKGRLDRAAEVLARLRSQPVESEFVQNELAEIVANHEYELSIIPQTGYIDGWLNCFRGSLWKANSNVRRTILGTSLQMMQQWTGVNFIFYYGTTFFQQLGTIQSAFLISMITTIVNVVSTPISFWTVERFGRRFLLIYGAAGMVVCQYIVAIVGTVKPNDDSAVSAMIAFICIYIFFFASTWGPGAWVLIGEIFPLQIRSRGVGLSTASNWLWNLIIAEITPYMVDSDEANMGPKVFFLWGSTCLLCFIYSIFLVPETKGLSLEQVDQMMEETTPWHSAKWVPTTTFASKMGMTDDKNGVEHVEKEETA